MLEAQPDFDPHDLKHEGAKTQRSAHVNDPYTYQEFPKLLYRHGKDGTEHLTVHSAESRDKAKGDGWSEEALAKHPEPAAGPEPVHVVIVEEKKPQEPVFAETKSSGVDGDAGDWTRTGDGTDYPKLLAQ